MAGVTTREEASTYAAPAQLGVAARKYVTEFIGTFFLTFALGVRDDGNIRRVLRPGTR